jgi:hypothetical protein
LRTEFLGVSIVADLKTADGGWLDAELVAKAGATQVVVTESGVQSLGELPRTLFRRFMLRIANQNQAMYQGD